jgi:hypothetical protein
MSEPGNMLLSPLQESPFRSCTPDSRTANDLQKNEKPEMFVFPAAIDVPAGFPLFALWRQDPAGCRISFRMCICHQEIDVSAEKIVNR